VATEQSTKGARADRRISKLVTFYESQLSSGDGQVQMQAANKLADILMRQLELKDRQAERQLKLDLADCNKRAAPLTPTTPSVPRDRDELIRQLQREVDAQAQARKKTQDEEIDPFA
jgi:hypothetical protein